MKRDIKRQLALVMLAVFLIASVLIYQRQEPDVLKVGVFAGSNWGVPDGDSYAVIDEVIKTFEQEHPGVRVTYVSGVKKEDYSE